MNELNSNKRARDEVAARRRFLAKCGRFAIATPPAVTLLLASAQHSYVAAQSGAKLKGNNGFGNGGGDPAPGNSGTNNSPNSGQKLDDIVR